MKLTQKEFADDLGVSLSYISKVESGQKMPGRELLENIATKYAVTVDFLLGREVEGSKLTDEFELMRLNEVVRLKSEGIIPLDYSFSFFDDLDYFLKRTVITYNGYPLSPESVKEIRNFVEGLIKSKDTPK